VDEEASQIEVKLRMDFEAIIKRCKKGDLMAYRLLYERFEQPFLHTALRMLGRQQDAEDAVQEAFLKLYRGIRHYKSGSRFSTYFFRILINSCYDILRKRSPVVSEEFDPSDLPYHPSQDAGLRVSIEEAISALPERVRISFVLFAVEGLKMEEIAQIMGIRVGTVKASIHRARIKLRAWLADSRKERTA
jgi:RNA polymerase sigma-70 factor (ECF subfamily)